MIDARRKAVKTIADVLYAQPFLNRVDLAQSVLRALVDAELIEFAPCKCGTFAFYTTHHWDGCTPDEIIG